MLSRIPGDTDLSAGVSGLTVALASPAPQYLQDASMTASEPPSLAPLALAMIRAMT